ISAIMSDRNCEYAYKEVKKCYCGHSIVVRKSTENTYKNPQNWSIMEKKLGFPLNTFISDHMQVKNQQKIRVLGKSKAKCVLTKT
ncbi:hypothetical protein, partial [Klebsiella pneumoniae]|uniref:hypothetical protein n=1 Tax=Klebsiella pneumoniae TaxID=573 RepID=UPI00272FC1AA